MHCFIQKAKVFQCLNFAICCSPTKTLSNTDILKHIFSSYLISTCTKCNIPLIKVEDFLVSLCAGWLLFYFYYVFITWKTFIFGGLLLDKEHSSFVLACWFFFVLSLYNAELVYQLDKYKRFNSRSSHYCSVQSSLCSWDKFHQVKVEAVVSDHWFSFGQPWPQ